MQTSECVVRIRYNEIGKYGVLRHSAIMDWYDVALCSMLDKIGTSYVEFEQHALFFPVLETHCRFISPARFDERILIKTSILELGLVKVKLKYEFYKEDDHTLVAVGDSAHAFVDDNMRPVNIKKVWPQLFESLKRFVEQA